ncbi:hypothetical protein JCM10207_006266 [Rhodosporidiobolus poonsookiae]
MHISSLASETIDDILEYVEQDNPHRLADLARVCQSSTLFLERARRLLYRTLRVDFQVFRPEAAEDDAQAELRYSATSQSLAKTLVGAPHLALFTRDFTLDGSLGSEYTGGNLYGAHWVVVCEMANTLLPLMPNLTSFCAPDVGCDAVYEAMLALESLPDINTLTLYRTTSLAWRMVARLPNLKELHLPTGVYFATDEATAPQLALDTLAIGFDLGDRYQSEWLTPTNVALLVQSSQSTLKNLQLGVSFRTFPPLHHFTALEHLVFDEYNLEGSGPATEQGKRFAGCTNLKTLTLKPQRLLSAAFVDAFCAPDTTGLGHNLPSAVKALKLLSPSFSPSNLVNVVRQLRADSALKHFSYMRHKEPNFWGICPGAPARPPQPGPNGDLYAELRAECERQGITMELVEDRPSRPAQPVTVDV